MSLRYIILFLISTCYVSYGQNKNFIDRPYLETTARADTLVVPDRLYLSIVLKETDTKDRISVEKQEMRMESALEDLGIDIKEQLFLADLATDFKDYFLRKTGVVKSKAYTLLVFDALTAGKAIQSLEAVGIANINFLKAELSDIEDLKLELRKKAVKRGLNQASAMLEPLGKTQLNVLYMSDINTGISYRARGRVTSMEATFAKADMEQPLELDFQKIKVESTISLRVAID